MEYALFKIEAAIIEKKKSTHQFVIVYHCT